MAQIFHPSMNVIAKASILGVVLLVTALTLGGYVLEKSPYNTRAGYPKNQPAPFSHEHHVRGLGIDCRYCHTSVEDSSFAGLPPTETCMTCHSQIWTNAEVLRPVRDSWASNQPLRWTRVNRVPDFVYFNHGIHVNKGVGCNTCHGEVDRMPLMWQAQTLQMGWCLACHREPEKYLRPRDQVFNMQYREPENQQVLGSELVEKYGVVKGQLTNCSVCHR